MSRLCGPLLLGLVASTLALSPSPGRAGSGGPGQEGKELPDFAPQKYTPPAPIAPPPAPTSAAGTESGRPEDLHISLGPVLGDVSPTGAVVWARASTPAFLHLEYREEGAEGRQARPQPIYADERNDFAASAVLEGLSPGTVYDYSFWFTTDLPGGGQVETEHRSGSFRTAPPPSESAPVVFAWGGDLGGGEYCRRVSHGYPIFRAIEGASPDFVLLLGNMIYADGDCPREGPDGPGGWENEEGNFPSITHAAISWTDLPAVRAVYWKHWLYNRSDSHLQHLLATVPAFAQWDGHEVLDPFGALWDHAAGREASREGFPDLVLAGRDAFLAYTPIRHDQDDPARLYRSFRYGSDLEVFLLDPRSYRSRDDVPDSPGEPKTLLGRVQRDWLVRGVIGSSATWKVVATPVPLSAPTGTEATGRDGWASGDSETGFEEELIALVAELEAGGVRNLVFVSSDARWPAEIRYQVDLDRNQSPFIFHEIMAGPLSAEGAQPDRLDPALSPRAVYENGGLRNFGLIRIEHDAAGRSHLRAEIRDEDGGILPGSELDLTAG